MNELKLKKEWKYHKKRNPKNKRYRNYKKIQNYKYPKKINKNLKNKAKEKNSTISDKNGENSTKVKEPIIPYSILKDNGITFNLDKGDDR